MRKPRLRVWHAFAFMLLVYVAVALAIYTLGWHAGKDSVTIEILDAVP